MRCENCGNILPGNAQTCDVCGARTGIWTNTPYKYTGNYSTGNVPPAGSASPARSSVPARSTAPAKNRKNTRDKKTSEKKRGMLWYKFIIYVQLIISALINLVYGVVVLSGFRWGMEVDEYTQVTELFSRVQVITIVIGVGYILMAAGAVYTRTMLARFRKLGPLCLIIYIAATIAKGLIDSGLFQIATNYNYGLGAPGLTVKETWLVELPTFGFLILIDIIYFRHRKYLFTN